MIDLKKELKKSIDTEVSSYGIPTESNLDAPKNKEFGDFSTNIAMQLSKELKKNPLEIAEELVEKFQNNQNLKDLGVVKIEAVRPGFINFYIDRSYYSKLLSEILNKENYGLNKSLENKSVLIEHTSPNPNKAFHLGHLKNNVTGLSISYILEASGAKVFRDCIDNNRGIAIAKMMWGYLKFGRKSENTPVEIDYWIENPNEWNTPEELNIDSDKYMAEMYVKGNEDFESNKESESAVRQMVIDFEADDQNNLKLWSLTQKWVWEGYEKIMKRIGGWKFDKIWHESDFYKQGKEVVQEGLEKGIFRKLEDGAILTNLKPFGLTDTIVIKNDGTSLYITQDLELSRLKKEHFKADQMFWVIGPEQSLAMKQMFAVCSQLGILPYEDFHHIAYGFVLSKNKDGNAEKMSSRKGTQIFVDELIDKSKVEILKFVKKDFSDEEKELISEKIAIAAIKYSLLKVERTKDMVFDLNTSISFEGDSAPYIIYTYTRAKSILNQYSSINTNSISGLDSENEIEVIKLLNEYPSVVLESSKSYEPSLIANYIYKLAQAFNSFYNSLSILNAETEELKNSRAALTKVTADVLQSGLGLLGIETVEKM